MAWLGSIMQVTHICDKQVGFYRKNIQVSKAVSQFSKTRSVCQFSLVLQLDRMETGL